MNKILIVLTIVGSLFASNGLLACDIDGKTGFIQKNDLRIPVNSLLSNDITKEKFDNIINRINKIYGPIIEAKGKKLIINGKWKTSEVNARAYQRGRKWHVDMFGGLARHPKNTADGFTIVLCHELGHHLGGSPRKNMQWASNEGQSDYWATLKCFRKFAQEDDNIKIVSELNIPNAVTEKCEKSFSTEDDIAICKRGSMGGHALGQVLKTLRKQTKAVKFSTPSKKVVNRTSDRHPETQCRLDTYFQGAICEIADDIEVSMNDQKVGACNRSDTYTDGVRPLCWFKPRS